MITPAVILPRRVLKNRRLDHLLQTQWLPSSRQRVPDRDHRANDAGGQDKNIQIEKEPNYARGDRAGVTRSFGIGPGAIRSEAIRSG